jgi:trehalose/maltose hydrolase-like predicted phosphorylase
VFIILVLTTSDDELTESHAGVWREFWDNFQIDVEGDDEMVKFTEKN